MAFLGSCIALALSLLAGVMGTLFTLRFLVSLWPGGLFLSLRRRLFLWTQPALEPVSSWFSFRVGGVDWTPIAAAVLCYFVLRGVAPALALLGFRLSGG